LVALSPGQFRPLLASLGAIFGVQQDILATRVGLVFSLGLTFGGRLVSIVINFRASDNDEAALRVVLVHR
jgi:hypothetical protein